MRQGEKRPLIGVTCGVREQNGHLRAGVSMSYIEAVQAAGGVPILVPPLEPDALAVLFSRLDGLLLTGGGDIDPELYGERPSRYVANVVPERDDTELALVGAAMESGMPLLGVCRGLQVINVAAGGTLVQDIPTQARSDIRHSQTQPRWQGTHPVTLEPQSALAAWAGSGELLVNSFHHQAIKDLGQGLRAIGWSPDGLIEAIEGARGNQFLIGVQWHPEDLVEHDPAAQALFRQFVEAAKNWKGYTGNVTWSFPERKGREGEMKPAPPAPAAVRPSGRRGNQASGSFRMR